jgi:hypothetical protein
MWGYINLPLISHNLLSSYCVLVLISKIGLQHVEDCSSFFSLKEFRKFAMVSRTTFLLPKTVPKRQHGPFKIKKRGLYDCSSLLENKTNLHFRHGVSGDLSSFQKCFCEKAWTSQKQNASPHVRVAALFQPKTPWSRTHVFQKRDRTSNVVLALHPYSLSRKRFWDSGRALLLPHGLWVLLSCTSIMYISS